VSAIPAYVADMPDFTIRALTPDMFDDFAAVVDELPNIRHRTMYEREGFTSGRRMGHGNCVMVRHVSPTPTTAPG
jgi:hypothetical protein